MERPCQETALLARRTESWSSRVHPDAEPLSDILFAFADVMTERILNYEDIGLVLCDLVGSMSQFRYCRRVSGPEKETRGQRQRKE